MPSIHHRYITLQQMGTVGWIRIVQTEGFYDARGRVHLELADATPAEAERGMAMLKKLVS